MLSVHCVKASFSVFPLFKANLKMRDITMVDFNNKEIIITTYSFGWYFSRYVLSGSNRAYHGVKERLKIQPEGPASEEFILQLFSKQSVLITSLCFSKNKNFFSREEWNILLCETLLKSLIIVLGLFLCPNLTQCYYGRISRCPDK